MKNDLVGSNAVRPYTGGITRHDDDIATIVLFQQNSAEDMQPSIFKDYFTDLSSDVKSLMTLSTQEGDFGFPEIPGGDIPILNLDGYGHPYYGVFNNFSVTNITEAHNQIVKVHMNFSATWNAFFFGETPSVYQFSGVFLDTQDYPYYQEFMVAYNKFLAGRKAVENNMQTKIMISGQIIDGFLLDVSVSHEASIEALKQFRFTVLVKGSSWIRINYINIADLNGLDDFGHKLISEKKRLSFNGLSNVGRNASDSLIDKVSSISKQRQPRISQRIL